MTISIEIPNIVMKAWTNAVESPDAARWRSVYIMAGCVAAAFHNESHDSLLAAAMHGISEEARQRMVALQPKRETA